MPGRVKAAVVGGAALVLGALPLYGFAGFYETTGAGIDSIAGVTPKSYTFTARKSLDVVAVQLARVGTGELTAKLVSDGVTRDSASTTALIGTLTLSWTPK